MKIFKKVICLTITAMSIFASASMFASCTTSHPEVALKLNFNNKNYTLEYKLYRKIAPATVQHFIELTEVGYYDGLCIHDYNTGTSMVTGGYTFENDKLKEKSYFETIQKENIKLTQTVWDDKDRTTPVNTVYGEFAENGFKVENNELKKTFGSLTMQYTPKDNCFETVYVKRADGNGHDPKFYKYNSATSLFSISLSESTSTDRFHCTFATLEEDSIDDLKSLIEEINKVIKDDYEDKQENFVEKETVEIDNDDPYMSEAKESATYSVPKHSIVIKSAKVTKY